MPALCRQDANLDGRISEDEMTAVLKTLNPKITPDSMRRLFSQADLNKELDVISLLVRDQILLPYRVMPFAGWRY